jgi:hypothetical protein
VRLESEVDDFADRVLRHGVRSICCATTPVSLSVDSCGSVLRRISSLSWA